MPGRQEANTVRAMQIQPRPPVISKKKALKADMVRKAERHHGRAGHDGADAKGMHVQPGRLDGRRISPTARSARPIGVR